MPSISPAVMLSTPVTCAKSVECINASLHWNEWLSAVPVVWRHSWGVWFDYHISRDHMPAVFTMKLYWLMCYSFRRQWDIFVVAADCHGGSPLPQTWVLPDPPSDQDWASALLAADTDWTRGLLATGWHQDMHLKLLGWKCTLAEPGSSLKTTYSLTPLTTWRRSNPRHGELHFEPSMFFFFFSNCQMRKHGWHDKLVS